VTIDFGGPCPECGEVAWWEATDGGVKQGEPEIHCPCSA
jgi:hypothetical protein